MGRLLCLGLVFAIFGNVSCQMPPGVVGQGNGWNPQQQGFPQQQGNPQQAPPGQVSSQFFINYFDVFTLPWNKLAQAPVVPSPNFNTFGQTYANNLTEIAKKCHPKGIFASFNPDHRAAVEDLTNLFQGLHLKKNRDNEYVFVPI